MVNTSLGVGAGKVNARERWRWVKRLEEDHKTMLQRRVVCFSTSGDCRTRPYLPTLGPFTTDFELLWLTSMLSLWTTLMSYAWWLWVGCWEPPPFPMYLMCREVNVYVIYCCLKKALLPNTCMSEYSLLFTLWPEGLKFHLNNKYILHYAT